MPILEWNEITEGVPSASTIIVDGAGIKLKRETVTGPFSYDPNALYVSAGAYIEFPELKASGLASVWSFHISGSANDGTVDCQLSGDGGATWLYYDEAGAAWAAAGVADWTLPSKVREHITTFPIGGGTERSIALRLRLRPDTTRTKTPVVTRVWFNVEYDHDAVIDVMRTVRRFIDSNVRPRLYTKEAADGSGTVTINTDYVVDDALGIQVYNLTDDPGRGTDLFAAYNAGTKLVTLSAAQDVGDVLYIAYRGNPPVYLTADEYFYKSEVPAITVEFTGFVDEDLSGNSMFEVNQSTKIARERHGPRYLNLDMNIVCTDKDQERSRLLTKEVRRIFHEEQCISLATANIWPVANVSGVRPRPNLASGVYSPSLTASLWVREEYEAYTQSALITTINMRTSGRGEGTWIDETQAIT